MTVSPLPKKRSTARPAGFAGLSAERVAATGDSLAPYEYKPDEVLVKLAPAGSRAFPDNLSDEYGVEVLEHFEMPKLASEKPGGQLVRLKLPSGVSVAEALTALREDQRVLYAEPNDIIRLPSTSEGDVSQAKEPHADLWGLENRGQTGGTVGADIKARQAWELTTGDRDTGPLIAVLDTGVDYTHPDLAANISTNPGEIPDDGIDNDGNGIVDDYYGYNAVEHNGDPMDGDRHGTHVAGTLAAVGDNNTGVVGVNWAARILPIKIFSDDGITSTDAIVRGVLYAAEAGAELTSNSWGTGRDNQAMREVFERTELLHVAGAGNNGSDTDTFSFYPASYDLPNVLSVGASDHNDKKPRFSNFGENSVDVLAPGENILSTQLGGGYLSLSGTSMATPHASGVALLAKHLHPQLSIEELKDRLVYSSDRKAKLSDYSVSGGRINAFRALEDDKIAPSTPSDLSFSEPKSREATLRWTAPSDDAKASQPVAAYELKLSGPKSGKVRLPAPSRPGQLESVVLRFEPELQPRTLHSSLQAIDNVGNRSQIATAEVSIPAAHIAFQDDESTLWSREGDWARVEVPDRGLVWSDSPDGNYGNGLNVSLTSPEIDLANVTSPHLSFAMKHHLDRSDELALEITNDGESWDSLKRVRGRAGWSKHEFDLSPYEGESIQFRFRLETNSYSTADGVLLDDLLILGDRSLP